MKSVPGFADFPSTITVTNHLKQQPLFSSCICHVGRLGGCDSSCSTWHQLEQLTGWGGGCWNSQKGQFTQTCGP